MDPWIKQVAWISDRFTKKPVTGVVLQFHGLGSTIMKESPESPAEIECARAGGLLVYPYYGPWAWMNRQARAMVDDLVRAVYREYKLADSVPLLSTGASMGGCSALLYTRYARKPVSACMALFPVCDLPGHFNERPDLPRTFLHAFSGYKQPLAKVLREHSPLHQVRAMPRIPYLVIHGDKDDLVNKKMHSDRFVRAMRLGKHDIEYVEVPGMGHGSMMPLSVVQKQTQFLLDHLVR